MHNNGNGNVRKLNFLLKIRDHHPEPDMYEIYEVLLSVTILSQDDIFQA
jgi:hypothetical protein